MEKPLICQKANSETLQTDFSKKTFHGIHMYDAGETYSKLDQVTALLINMEIQWLMQMYASSLKHFIKESKTHMLSTICFFLGTV